MNFWRQEIHTELFAARNSDKKSIPPAGSWSGPVTDGAARMQVRDLGDTLNIQTIGKETKRMLVRALLDGAEVRPKPGLKAIACIATSG